MLFWQILIDGFAISSLYALGATGFALIFGVSGVLNLSHGALMVAAVVAAWAAGNDLHVGPYAERRLASPSASAPRSSLISSSCGRCRVRAKSARRKRKFSSSPRRCSGAS
jgi:branched-subunit amino acid ABC-type transport system permease component